MARAKKKPGNKQSAADSVYKREAGETALQYASRITRHETNQRDKSKPLVSPQAEQHGDYADVFILHDETSTLTRTKKNNASSIVEKWISDGGIGFDAGAVTAIRHCQFLWERAGSPQITSHYGERIPGGSDGTTWDEARDELHRLKKQFPVQYWNVFENVVRFHLPAGVAGSDLAANSAQSISAAKNIVGMIASMIAMKNGY